MSPIKVYILSCFLLLNFCLSLKAQNRKIDSLQKVLQTTKEDTVKMVASNLLSKQFLQINTYDKARKYADDAKALADKLLLASKTISQTYLAKKTLSKSNNNIGLVYYYQGYYPEALKHYFISLKLREEIGDKEGIAASYNNIAIIYNNQHDYKQSLKYHSSSLKIKEEINDKLGIAISYVNLGAVNEQLNNYDVALKNYFIALKMYDDLGIPQGVAMVSNNIGVVYEAQGHYDEAFQKYSGSLKVKEEVGDKEGMVASYISMASVLLKMSRLDNGLSEKRKKIRINLNKALELSKETGLKEAIKESYNGLYVLDSMLANDKSALQNYKMYIQYSDSLQNEENTKKIVQSEMNFEFDKKEAAAKLEQEKKEAVAVAESRKQKVIIWSVCGILLLVFCFAVFAYRSYLQKQKANVEITLQKQVIEEKQKEILDSIYYARRIQRTLLLNEKYIDKNLNRLMTNS